jgi:hypothetical protein
VVGLIVLVIEPDHLLIESIAVEPDGRSRGSDAA